MRCTARSISPTQESLVLGVNRKSNGRRYGEQLYFERIPPGLGCIASAGSKLVMRIQVECVLVVYIWALFVSLEMCHVSREIARRHSSLSKVTAAIRDCGEREVQNYPYSYPCSYSPVNPVGCCPGKVKPHAATNVYVWCLRLPAHRASMSPAVN